MRLSKRWLHSSALIATIIVAWGISTHPIALAHEEGRGAQLKQAVLLYQHGMYREAIPFAKEALKAAEHDFGPDHPKVTTSLSYLALLYRALEEYDQAEPLYQRALAIDEKALGPDHTNVAINLDNLANVYRAQGRHAEAEPISKRALEIFEKALGPDDLHVAINLTNLAEIYSAQ